MSRESSPAEADIRQAIAHLYSDNHALDAAVRQLMQQHSESVTEPIAGVDLDLQRAVRCGFPEVVYGEGKSAETVVQILAAQQAAGQDSLVTRATDEQVAATRREFPGLIHNASARTIRVHQKPVEAELRGGPVFVVTAGSSDRAVAEEALETLLWMRVQCELIQDVGVAGPHRLQRHIPKLQTAVVIVCVAGMEAALPSVLGGYVACPVIGVPTSVGYGASLQGITAMLSMLTCCASNVVCVNIDAGFKGGYVAGLIATRSKD
jgi:NCAIR mutase (PurE)-related protein